MIHRFYILLLCSLLLSCSKVNNSNPFSEPPITYVSHQFKDRLSSSEITDRISHYIPDANSLLHTQYDVTVYRVFYKTHDYKNNELIASGLVYIPEVRHYFLPVISYQHGSAIGKTEVPSMTGDFDYYIPFMLASESGAIVCETDGIGLGFSGGKQHYFEPTEEANAVVDLLRSVEVLFQKTLRPLNLTRELFLAGYSQGGHATLAAQRLLETKHPYEWIIKASAPMAGFFSFEKSSQFNVLKDPIEYPISSVYPFLIYSINSTQESPAPISYYFIPPYDSLVQEMFDGNHTTSFINAQFPNQTFDILQPVFRNELKTVSANPFLMAAKRYDIINDWVPKAPTRFYHSHSDEIAFYDNSEIAFNTFNVKGGNVQFINLGELTHLEGNVEAIQQIRTWFYPNIRLQSY